jgi:hypothetical protein
MLLACVHRWSPPARTLHLGAAAERRAADRDSAARERVGPRQGVVAGTAGSRHRGWLEASEAPYQPGGWKRALAAADGTPRCGARRNAHGARSAVVRAAVRPGVPRLRVKALRPYLLGDAGDNLDLPTPQFPSAEHRAPRRLALRCRLISPSGSTRQPTPGVLRLFMIGSRPARADRWPAEAA